MPLIPVDRLQTLSPATVGSETESSFSSRALEGRHDYTIDLDVERARFRLMNPRKPGVVVYIPMGNVAWWSEPTDAPATVASPELAPPTLSAAGLAALVESPEEDVLATAAATAAAAAAAAADRIEAGRRSKYRSIREIDGARE